MNSIPKFACVVITMGNNKIIFAQFYKKKLFKDPKTMKKQRNIEKGCKDIKDLPTFPTVSKLNGVCAR